MALIVSLPPKKILSALCQTTWFKMPEMPENRSASRTNSRVYGLSSLAQAQPCTSSGRIHSGRSDWGYGGRSTAVRSKIAAPR